MAFYSKFFKSSKVAVAETKLELEGKAVRESLGSEGGRDRLNGLISSIEPAWKAASVIKIVLQTITPSDSRALHKVYRDYFETTMLTEDDARKALKSSRASIDAFLKKPDTNNDGMLFVAKLVQDAEKKLPAYTKTEKMTKDLSSWWRRAYFNLFVFQSYPVLKAAQFIHNAFNAVNLSESPKLEKIYDDNFSMLLETEDGARKAFKNAQAGAKAFLDKPDTKQGAMIYIAEKIQNMAENIKQLEEIQENVRDLRQRSRMKISESNKEKAPPQAMDEKKAIDANPLSYSQSFSEAQPSAPQASRAGQAAGKRGVNALNQEEIWEKLKNLPNAVNEDSKQQKESEHKTPRTPRTP